MKYLLFFLFITGTGHCFSQEASLKEYKDASGGFSISIPDDWHQAPAKGTVRLIVYRTAAPDTAKPLENFNLNIIASGNSTLDKEYDNLVAALATGHNHTISEKGDITINGNPGKWFVETHKGAGTIQRVWNYDFIIYKKGKTYILTCVATSGLGFEKYRPLFLKIASSLSI